MTQSGFFTTYLSLFAGRPDVYAIRHEWTETNALGEETQESCYWPSDYSGEKRGTQRRVQECVKRIGSAEYGLEAARAHVRGDQFLGIYPLHADNTVRFAAMDFDGKNGDPWEEALRQQEVLHEEAGLVSYLERSRSGNGYHVWLFFEEALPARVVRRALRPYLEAAETFDRMFPLQDECTPTKPYGNLIALPLYGPAVQEGKGVFVYADAEGKPQAYADQKAFLAEVERIPAEVMYRLFEEAPEVPGRGAYMGPPAEPIDEESGTIPGIYKVTSTAYGCEFVRWCWDHADEVTEPEWYTLACQFAKLTGGREMFHRYSERDPARYNVRATDEKFNHALRQASPQTSAWIRETLSHGPGCRCDERFPGKVRAPWQLALLPVSELVGGMEQERVEKTGRILIREAAEWAREVERDPEGKAGIAYGIPELDQYTSLRGGELIVVGARPGIGKSAIMVDVMTNVAERRTPAYAFSMEMPADHMGRRLLCRKAEVDHGRLITGRLAEEEWARIQATVAAEDEFPILLDDRTRDTGRMLDIAGEWVFRYGKGPIFVDYLQMCRKRQGESTPDAVGRFAYEFKWMAKILDVPVVALAQLNRTADEATGESQTFDSWLRNSGDIEAAADVIHFLLGEKTGDSVAQRVIVIHKERHRGGGHRVHLEMNQPLMRFAAEGTWGVAPLRGSDSVGALLGGAPLVSMQPVRRSLMDDESSWTV